LMVFSVALGLISLGSVLYIRKHGHDLTKGQSSYRWSTSDQLPSYGIPKPKVLGKIVRMPITSDGVITYTFYKKENKSCDQDIKSARLNAHCQILGTKSEIDGMRMIRLLLVDDQSIVRQGLRMRLLLEPDILVVGEASSGEQAIELVHELAPDIVLMDVEMPGMDGITATAALRAATTQSAVVMMSIHDDTQTRVRAQAAGAAAFVEKTGTLEKLLATIHQVVEFTGTA